MSGKFIDLRKSLVTTIMFPCKNFILYFLLLGSLVFISTRSAISLCTSFLYLRETPIWKGFFGVLVCVKSLQTLFDELSRGISNLFYTSFLINSYSTSLVKPIGFTVLVYYLVLTEVKEKLNVQFLDIIPTLLKNIENLLNPSWVFN